jgi:hypothetical protein
MPRVGVEPTIPAFERAKTVHPLGRPHTGMRVTVKTRCLRHDAKKGAQRL